jgi:glycosyltransferase involved in cell wall biosynthesis
MRIYLKSPALYNKFCDQYGFGKVYHSLVSHLRNNEKIVLVDPGDESDLQVCLCLPDVKWDFFHWWGRDRYKRQVISTVWETTMVPYGWVDVINSGIGFITASNWCKEVFRNNGVDVPIHVVPHGVDVEKFPLLERDWESERFYFLWQGMHPYDRKGLQYVRQAFAELDLKNAWLVEKWYPMVSSEWGPHSYPSERRIEIGRFMQREEYLNLLQQCHVSVNPFRGEGFGLMPLETACTGMMTIATNWSGPVDYLNPECFWPLKYKLSEPQQDYISTSLHVDFITAPAQDAIPDIEDLKAAMRWAYENRKSAQFKGNLAHRYVKDNWSWSKATEKFVEACEKCLG